MIITCPNCSTQYSLSPKSIGVKGKKVKCIKCGNIWHQELPPHLLEELQNYLEEVKKQEQAKLTRQNEARQAGDSSSHKVSYGSPAVVKKVLPIYKVMALVSIVFMVVAFLISFRGSFIELNIYEDVALTGLKANVFVEDNKYRLNLRGSVKNLSSTQEYKMPRIHTTVLSAGGAILGQSFIEPSIKELPAEKEIFFQAEISGISGNANLLILDIGTDFEVGLR